MQIKRQKSCYCDTFLRVCLMFTLWKESRTHRIQGGRNFEGILRTAEKDCPNNLGKIICFPGSHRK